MDNIGEPVLLEQYVALKDYKKQYHNDINLTNGYTMDVIEKHESGELWLPSSDRENGSNEKNAVIESREY